MTWESNISEEIAEEFDRLAWWKDQIEQRFDERLAWFRQKKNEAERERNRLRRKVDAGFRAKIAAWTRAYRSRRFARDPEYRNKIREQFRLWQADHQEERNRYQRELVKRKKETIPGFRERVNDYHRSWYAKNVEKERLRNAANQRAYRAHMSPEQREAHLKKRRERYHSRRRAPR